MKPMADPTPRQIEEPVRAECERAGRYFKVSGVVHPLDYIFWFVHDHPSFNTPAKIADFYFESGRISAQKVRDLVREAGGVPAAPALLEFAAGYGCVTRHLRNEFPEARVTASDIHDEALDFISAAMGTAVLRSAHVPENFRTTQSYDVVVAISFFSHMPAATWQRWLQALADRLAPGGLLIFTTHGVASLPHCGNPDLGDDGYWFAPVSEQKDLAGEEYGCAVTAFDWVNKQIGKTTGVRLIRFQEAFWFGHQDVYVLRGVS
jgi:SAM-dependent methyltransferase